MAPPIRAACLWRLVAPVGETWGLIERAQRLAQMFGLTVVCCTPDYRPFYVVGPDVVRREDEHGKAGGKRWKRRMRALMEDCGAIVRHGDARDARDYG